MALEEFYEYGASMKSFNSKSLPVNESENNNSRGFDCNICLGSVEEAVVTLCGHLYCWPCIYKWIRQQSRCPVCKAHVSETTLIPLYGGDESTKRYHEKASEFGTVIIPNRPQSPSCIASQTAASNLHGYHPYPHGYMAAPMFHFGGSITNVTHPAVGMFGEMVYAIFGNSETALLTIPDAYNLAGTITPRVRRHIMEVDRSLGRLCFFLFCCMVLCLLLF